MEATQAQEKFWELLALVGEGEERIIIRHLRQLIMRYLKPLVGAYCNTPLHHFHQMSIESEGQVVAAVISYADLKRLEALEDARDVADFQRAVTESNGESYSVEEVINYYNELHDTDFTAENIRQ